MCAAAVAALGPSSFHRLQRRRVFAQLRNRQAVQRPVDSPFSPSTQCFPGGCFVTIKRLISSHLRVASTCPRVVLLLRSAIAVLLMGVALSAAVQAQTGTGDWTWMGGSAGRIGVIPMTRGALGVPSAQYSPGERQWSAAWTGADGSFWLFGGWGDDATGASGSLNDLWRFTPATNEWTWMSGSASLNTAGDYGTLSSPAAANTPGARYQADTWMDKSGNLWLFGGWGYDSAGTLGYLNDLWMYNIATKQWTWMSGSNLANQFSAFGSSGQSSANYIPGSRYSGMSWVDASGNFWLFGGAGDYLNDSSDINVTMNDLWKYSPSSGEWTWYGGELPASYGTLGHSSASNEPGERNGGATWVDANGTLWLFGGFGIDALSNVGVLSDLWSLNPANLQWTWVSGPNVSNSTGDYGVLGVASASNYSPGRMFTNVWQDKSGNVWIFGGGAVNTANQQTLLNDQWQYAPATNLWTWVAGTPLADVSQFAVDGVYGTLGVPDAANIPGGRVAAANWTDPQGNFWLYGGNWGPFISSGSPDSYLSFDDLWVYTPPASANAPQAVLSPLQLSFAAPIGEAAPMQTVTLSNPGGAALTISSIGISGANANVFSESNTCGASLAAGGSCTITVTFAPAATGLDVATLTVTDNAATTLPIALNGIAQAQTTLTLSAVPASTSTVLNPVKLTATLSPSSDSAASTDGEFVNFRNGGQYFGRGALTNGVATMTTTQLPFGTNTLTASYAGDAYFAAATSAALPFTVTHLNNLTATQTTLAFLVSGQPVTSASCTSLVNLAATVTSNGSPVTPGIVTFCDAAYASCVGQGLIGIAQTNSKGVATFPMRFGAGAHQVVARFQVQSSLAASVSPGSAISIDNALTTASLASSGTSAGYELTATITGLGPKTAPTGSVQFIDTSNNNAVLGTVQLEGATESQSYVVGPEIPDTAGYGWYTTTADLNGDGIPDVIVVNGVTDQAANSVPETIQVYLGKGDGTFAALAPQQIVANSPSGVASLPIFDSAPITVGDFNQDGIPDLAVGLSQSPTADGVIANSIAILLGNGDGTFAVQPTQLQPINGSAFLAAPVVADFNGDGIPDILATYGIVDFDYSVLYLGNGDGTFQTATATTPISFFETSVPFPTYLPAVSDFNGDGIPDVGFVSQLGAYSEINLGNGTFSSVLTADTLPPPIDQEPSYVPIVGDFNGDGKPDMAVTSTGASVPIFLGNGDGTFTTGPQTPTVPNESWNLVAADFAGNGFDGFASANDDTNISVFNSNGDGTFTQQNVTVGVGHTSSPGTIPFFAGGIAAGDFHNSGRKDIVLSVVGDYAIQTVENRLTETATVKLENVRLAGSGTHNIVAVYSGDSLFATSTSSSVALGAESLISTTTSLTVNPAQALTGTPVTLNATATPTSGTTTPTGDISFLDGSSVLAVLPVSSNGTASFSSSSFAAGTHSFTAVYSGDASNLTSTSQAVPATYTTATAKTTPTVTVSPSPTSITTTQADTVTVTVSGGSGNPTPTGSVTLTSGTYTSAATTLASGSAMITVPAGSLAASTDTLTATYTPDSATSSTYNSATGSNTVTVTGTTAPIALIYPSSLTFSPTLINTTNSGQFITLANTGTAFLTGITASIIGANASNFAIASNTCSTLNLGATCTISVTFTPPTAGTFNATLSIADNAGNSPQSVPLSGSGTATQELASITPSFLAFADQPVNTASGPVTVTLANIGSTALTGISSAITGAGASAFAMQASTCGTSLAAGASCSISVTFTPSSTATFNATLTVTDDATNSPQAMSLSGAGIAASATSAATLSTTSLTFPNTAIGASSPLTVTVTNSGTLPLTIEGAIIGSTYYDETSGLSSPGNVFPQTSTCGSSLAVGASCAITVTFTPSAAGPYIGTLLIADTSSSFAQSVALSGAGIGGAGVSAVLEPTPQLNFGTVPLNTTSAPMTATLTNTGSATLTGITPSLSGTSAASFAISGTTCGSLLAPGAACTISLAYTSNASGQFAATLTVADNAPGSPQQEYLFGGTGCSSLSTTSVTNCNPGGSLVVTETTGSALAFQPATVTTATATAASTEIIGKYQGKVVYDQTFPAAYGTPTVQSAVTAANAAIVAAGGSGAVIPAPALVSTSTSTSTASTSVYSRDPAAPVATNESAVTFGPAIIRVGFSDVSVTPYGSLTSTDLTECTEASLPSSTIPTCYATDPGLFQVLPGQEDINVNTTLSYFIDTATTTTTTTTTAAAYAIDATSSATATPAVTVTPSPTSITTTQADTVTVTVSGGSGNPTPTGSVTLTSGSYTSAATTLVSGSAMITVPAGSLATSTDTLTATYTPDSASTSTYNSATGTNTVTVTAAAVQITVGTSPAGLAFSVDGTSYSSTQTLSWTVGSSHTIATTSPQTSAGAQNTFTSWSDEGAMSHSVTAPSGATSYTAMFATSYQLTTTANPAAGGSVTPTSGTYYASGTVVNLTATPNSGYTFANWTGSVESTSSASTTITMSAPESVTANFTAVATPTFTVSSSTMAQTIQPGGSAQYTITVTSQNGAFLSAVTLAASGLPPGATASFSQGSITPGSSSASSTLTIQTASTNVALTNRGSPWPLAAPALAVIGMFVLPGRTRRRWITLAVLAFASLGAFSALTACGGGFGFRMGAAATNYTITVTGSSGSVQQSTTVQLTVE
jgi:N-acetylneuraminic acid mutarotase